MFYIRAFFKLTYVIYVFKIYVITDSEMESWQTTNAIWKRYYSLVVVLFNEGIKCVPSYWTIAFVIVPPKPIRYVRMAVSVKR